MVEEGVVRAGSTAGVIGLLLIVMLELVATGVVGVAFGFALSARVIPTSY